MAGPNSLRQILNRLKQRFFPGAALEPGMQPADPARQPRASAPGAGALAPIAPRVGVIVIDPLVPTQAGPPARPARLTQVLGWNDPMRLIENFIADLRHASYGYLNYQVVESTWADEFPPMQDGFTYRAEDYLRRWRTGGPFHQPDKVDYAYIVARFDLLARIRQAAFDEVWVMCFPYGGFYESRMAGPGAFFCNSGPLPHTDAAMRRFVIMCFNPERGPGEMLESYGHRAESILEHVFRGVPGEQNLWRRFTRYDLIAPGKAEVGNIHFAPNSVRDYDWGNRRKVLSHSRAWLNFPDLSSPPVPESCAAWGHGDIRAHHLWWLRHLPHVGGETYGITNNWWEYIADPNKAR